MAKVGPLRLAFNFRIGDTEAGEFTLYLSLRRWFKPAHHVLAHICAAVSFVSLRASFWLHNVGSDFIEKYGIKKEWR